MCVLSSGFRLLNNRPQEIEIEKEFAGGRKRLKHCAQYRVSMSPRKKFQSLHKPDTL